MLLLDFKKRENGTYFVGEAVVVPLPGELLLDESSGLQGLHELDHVKVGNLYDEIKGS